MERKINESYILGFELEEDSSMSVAVVLRRDKEGLKQIKVFEAEEAEKLYKTLTNK